MNPSGPRGKRSATFFVASLFAATQAYSAYGENLNCPSPEYCRLIRPENVLEQLALARKFAEKMDPGNTLDWYGRAARLGNQEAMVALSFMLAEEVFTRRNLQKADAWFDRAKQQDQGSAEYLMAQQYLQWGRRLNRQEWIDKAPDWFRQAAAHNHRQAQDFLASMAKDHPVLSTSDGRPLGLSASSKVSDDPDAEFKLGLMYKIGSDIKGIKKDPDRAAELFLDASNKGHACAQNELGMMYLQGVGVPQDDAVGVNWIKQAANKCGLAVFNMGLLYEAGRGVQKDDAQAKYWFDKAERGGLCPETTDAVERRNRALAAQEKSAKAKASEFENTIVALGFLGVVYLMKHPLNTPPSTQQTYDESGREGVESSSSFEQLHELNEQIEQEEQAERDRQSRIDEDNESRRQQQERDHELYMQHQDELYGRSDGR